MLFALEVLGIDEAAFGLLLAVIGLGAVLGAILLSTLARIAIWRVLAVHRRQVEEPSVTSPASD